MSKLDNVRFHGNDCIGLVPFEPGEESNLVHTMHPAVPAGRFEKTGQIYASYAPRTRGLRRAAFFINDILDTTLRFSPEWFEFNHPGHFAIQ